MWGEIYYEHYRENCRGRYWEMEEKILPYSIKCKNNRTKRAMEDLLRKDGLKCVWTTQCMGLLVNFTLKRFCSYPMPAKMSCIGSHSYTEEEFLSQIYYPWYFKTKYWVDAETARPIIEMYLKKYRSRCREPGLSDEEMLEEQIVLV